VSDAESPDRGVAFVVTDHAVERFRQRVAASEGALDSRVEIAGRSERRLAKPEILALWRI
jgi:hypothetical protein